MMPDIAPAQVQEARALLRWSRDRLAALAEITVASLTKFERSGTVQQPSVLAAIRTTLEEAGVVFADENDEGPCVKLRTVD